MKRKDNLAFNERIGILDELKGIAIICMVVYHGFFTMTFFPAFASFGYSAFDFFTPAEPYFAGLFIVISGICVRLSHSPAKRGLMLLIISLLLTGATLFLAKYISGVEIYFGILHMLACCMLLFALLKPVLNKIPALVGIPLNIIFFAAVFNIEQGYIGFKSFFSLPLKAFFILPDWITNCEWLFPLGIHSAHFTSADYFPIFPWLFLFLAGSFLGKFFEKGKIPGFMKKTHLKFLAAPGKMTLIIYLVHQPVIYGILYLVDMIIK